MKNKNSLIDETLFQIQSLEETINKNAQGILASTMKEEINSLVKESLKEAEEDEDEEIEVDVDSEEDDDDLADDSEMDLMGDDESDEDEETDNLPTPVEPNISMGTEDDETIDATEFSDDELLTVFRSLEPTDSVVVKKDDNMIHLKDTEKDVEYLIQLGESMANHLEDEDEYEMKEGSRRHRKFDDEDDDEFSFDDEDGLEIPYDMPAYKTKYRYSDGEDDDAETIYELEVSEDMDMLDASEIELGEADDDIDMLFMGDDFDDEELYSLEEMEDEDEIDLDAVMESKKGFKAKGVGMGSASKYKMSKKPNMEGGFKTIKKNANKTMGTGKAKFEYKEGVNSKGFGEKAKKMETKEASRTYGNGKDFRGGLPKRRAHSDANINIKKNVNEEVVQLKEKNEEYRKALNIFRDKLNEVAVFNSNLAYATRLFTEHSTTKQEKINILKRFDDVQTIKESKNLYRMIKDSLSSGVETEKNNITESIERTVSKTPASGSAVNLIESKTYENPQFLRMKDLMGKIK
jgi:hypothetical protein